FGNSRALERCDQTPHDRRAAVRHEVDASVIPSRHESVVNAAQVAEADAAGAHALDAEPRQGRVHLRGVRTGKLDHGHGAGAGGRRLHTPGCGHGWAQDGKGRYAEVAERKRRESREGKEVGSKAARQGSWLGRPVMRARILWLFFGPLGSL